MFWILEQPQEGSLETIHGVLNIDPSNKIWQTEMCQSCNRPTVIRQINDLAIDIYGNELQGFVWIDDAQIIVDESLYKIISDANIRGVSFRKVKVISWYQLNTSTIETHDVSSLIEVPILYQLVAEGDGGSLISTNEMKLISSCKICGLAVFDMPKGIRVNEALWDGSDVFTTKEFPGMILVTDKFIDILKLHNIKNYRSVKAIDYS